MSILNDALMAKEGCGHKATTKDIVKLSFDEDELLFHSGGIEYA